MTTNPFGDFGDLPPMTPDERSHNDRELLRAMLNQVKPEKSVAEFVAAGLKGLRAGRTDMFDQFKSWARQIPLSDYEAGEHWKAASANPGGLEEAIRQQQRALTASHEPRFAMQFVTGGEQPVPMEYYIDPWLPRRTVVGMYGRGETGKSTWSSWWCASVSASVSTLWITSEEDTKHVSLRFTQSGGHSNTLIVLPAALERFNPESGKLETEIFDVYNYLDGMIFDYGKAKGYRQDRPLGIVVLDAINALVTWAKGENANDDASVKRLLAYLHTLAMTRDLTIIILGHVNKNTGKEHVADAVTGSAAWTNSVRRAYLLYKDQLSDEYEGFIRTAKGNTGTHFAASYKTVPVFTLHKRAEGADEVLCKIELTGPIVWGEREIARLIHDSADDDPLTEKRKKRSDKIQQLVRLIAHNIRAGATTRVQIENALPSELQPVHPRYWAKIDDLLQRNCEIDVRSVSAIIYLN